MDKFTAWFEKKFLDWQSSRGRRASIREFSEWLEINQNLVASWMGGYRKPGPDYADRICIALDYDLTIYELLGLPVPEKRLLEFKAMYPTLTDEDVADLDKFLEKVRKRHAAEEKRNLSKTGPVDPDGGLLHAGRTP
ncbi:MAG: hypothetical protein ACOYBO_00955 [Azonexus sp.]